MKVPDARCRAESWLRGEITTAEANYWLLGGHCDRLAHRGKNTIGGAPCGLTTPITPSSIPPRYGFCLKTARWSMSTSGPEDTCNMRARAHLPARCDQMAAAVSRLVCPRLVPLSRLPDRQQSAPGKHSARLE
jgi:hypothetical protein